MSGIQVVPSEPVTLKGKLWRGEDSPRLGSLNAGGVGVEEVERELEVRTRKAKEKSAFLRKIKGLRVGNTAYARHLPQRFRSSARAQGMDSPGPGAYNPPMRSTSVGITMLGNNRTTVALGRDSPGPKYKPKSSLGGRHFSLIGRGNEFQRTVAKGSPGPAAYDPVHPSQRGRLGTTFKGKKVSLQNFKERSCSPGPIYMLPSTIGNGPRVSIKGSGRSVITDREDSTPAPNAYNLQMTKNVNHVKGCAFKGGLGVGRFKLGEGSDAPSAQSYDITRGIIAVKPTAPSHSLSSRHHVRKSYETSPGPQYDIEGSQSNAHGYSFSKGIHRPKKGTAGPGPGAYLLPSTIGMGVSAPFTGRPVVLSPRAQSPGPGAYTLKTSSFEKGRGVSMKGRHFDSQNLEATYTPGPNKYSPNLRAVGPQPRSWTMGRRTRHSLHDHCSPGPIYAIKSTIGSSTAVTIKGRLKDA